MNSSGNDTSWTLDVNSVDGLANNVHTFVDLPFGLTNDQVLNMISSSNQDTQEDTNLWQLTTGGQLNGNHTVTIVSYKPDGTYNIQRFSESQYSFLGVTTGYGAGFGDLAGTGTITTSDISQFITLVESGNTQFNAAADLNGDGSIDLADTFLLGPALSAANVSSSVWNAYNNFIYGSYVTTHGYTVNGKNVIYQDTAYTTSLSAGAYLNATYIRGTSLNIAAGGKVQIQANPTFGGGASKISYLSMGGTTGAWTGQIDLTNNPLVFESTPANKSSDLARLTNMVAEGYAGGTWVGEGITSSSAATDTTHLHALGIILNDTPSGSTLYSSFYNETADSNAILISYTYYGDANLDGKVDGSDYTLMDNGYLKHLTGWNNGDFNYDGIVNGSDYTLIDNAFNQQGAAGTNPATLLTQEIAVPTAEFLGGFASSVPEPASVGLLALGLAGLLGRKRTVSAGRITRYTS